MKVIKDKQKMNQYIEEFKIQNIFSKDIIEFMDLVKYEKGEVICMTNIEMEYFYLFVEGKVKIYTLLENGKSLLLRFYEPLKFIGDLEYTYSNRIAKTNVESMMDSYLIRISYENIDKYCFDDSIFLRNICNSLAYKLDFLSNSSSINLLYSVEKRLAAYLVSVTEEESRFIQEMQTKKITELADLLGTSYRHLNRVIKKLSEIGVIKREDNFIKIIDRVYLEGLAGDIYK
jgi:CRP-like cAMP-binding protein